jgi:hypothetical protein
MIRRNVDCTTASTIHRPIHDSPPAEFRALYLEAQSFSRQERNTRLVHLRLVISAIEMANENSDGEEGGGEDEDWGEDDDDEDDDYEVEEDEVEEDEDEERVYLRRSKRLRV